MMASYARHAFESLWHHLGSNNLDSESALIDRTVIPGNCLTSLRNSGARLSTKRPKEGRELLPRCLAPYDTSESRLDLKRNSYAKVI